jgi:hypothetical protein
MQLELALRDWRPMKFAPQNAEWVEVDSNWGIALAHFACDLSGSEQPPFIGWFVDVGSYFSQVQPKRWRPIA